jgi:hypothetical protein
MKLINDATIWMKSYAIKGRSSIEEGVDCLGVYSL